MWFRSLVVRTEVARAATAAAGAYGHSRSNKVGAVCSLFTSQPVWRLSSSSTSWHHTSSGRPHFLCLLSRVALTCCADDSIFKATAVAADGIGVRLTPSPHPLPSAKLGDNNGADEIN